jgi:major membrane immunogen (membrane-anchored lipoprotein)
MKLTIALLAVLTLTLSAAGVAGTWKGSMDTQMGMVETVITLQTGSALTGKVKAGDYEAQIENAKAEGDKVHFEINIDPGKVTYDGTVAGDEMKLKVTGTQGNEYSLVCKRQK